MGILTRTQGVADPVLTRIVDEDEVPWYKKKNLRLLYLVLFPTCIGTEMTSGFDSQMINSVQIVDPWQEYFGHPAGPLKGIISAAYNLGAICALPFIPFINDRFGRRLSIVFGSFVMIVGAFIQGFAQNSAMYVIARLILGFGIPFCIVASSSMIGELAYPKERPILTSMFNSCYFIGQVVAAGISFGTQSIGSNWAWRIPSLLQAVPSILQIVFVIWLPESPRFLISRDRYEEAFNILTTYHAEADHNSEFVRAEMTQIQETIKIEKEHSKTPWWDLFRTGGMRRRVVIAAFLGLFTQWSGNTLISYYLNDLLVLIGYTDPQFKGKMNVGLSAWYLVNATAIALVVKRFKRRHMYLTCACLLLCVYIGWTISMERFLSTNSKAAAKLTIFFIWAYSPCYNIGYNALTYTFLVELFPYAQRTAGIACFQFFGRGAGFFTTFVNPIGLENIKWKWLMTYCCWLGFEVVVIYFLWPETSGRTLEELAFLFEDKGYADRATLAVEKTINHEDNFNIKGGSGHIEEVQASTNQKVLA